MNHVRDDEGARVVMCMMMVEMQQLLEHSCASYLLHIVQERPKGVFGQLDIHDQVKQMHGVVEIVPV